MTEEKFLLNGDDHDVGGSSSTTNNYNYGTTTIPTLPSNNNVTTAIISTNSQGGGGGGEGGSSSSPATTTIPTPLSSPSSIRHRCRRSSSIAAVAAAEVILHDRKVRKESISVEPPIQKIQSMASLEVDNNERNNSYINNGEAAIRNPVKSSIVQTNTNEHNNTNNKKNNKTNGKAWDHSIPLQNLQKITTQLPAIALASVLNFMCGIPFGASYFPTEFDLPSKQILGLRMFLFSTCVAQFTFTYKSQFVDCIGLQMVENVPFYLELARIVMEEQEQQQGEGAEGIDVRAACSTLFFLFGLSSLIVGMVFYLLGTFELGRVVYFFPTHVLMGCIGGIGAFIVVTCLEVTTDTEFSFTSQGFDECILQHLHLLAPVVGFEVVLRVIGRFVKYPLLGPIYFCFITPVLYAILWALDIPMERAVEAGYFFPPLNSSSSFSSGSSSSSVFETDLFDIFTQVHFDDISWTAVGKAAPTMISLAVFSLFHVPINIPAFAISTRVEPDMNAELIAHGYSNALVGLFGGLQNYLCYSNSVIYSKSNGKGKWSSLTLVAITVVIFIYGPTLASYVPRCMAGTLLLHVGIDLILEGVVETREDYDKLEYSGIWLITIVMVTFGMDAALIAGAVAALSTYAAQSMMYQDPIRGSMSGVRLRSSAWNRGREAQEILDGEKNGRQRIFSIQLQGHIFFGNVTKMADDVKKKLKEKFEAGDEPAVVILDFTNSLGLDSSAAQSIAKLKSFLLENFDVEILLFVTGHEDGFRCTYDLSHQVVDGSSSSSIEIVERMPSIRKHSLTFTARALASQNESKSSHIAKIPNSRVCKTLDEALIFAEDVLIALEDPSILQTDSKKCFPYVRHSSVNEDKARSFLEDLVPSAPSKDMDTLHALLSPEKYYCGEIVWEQGDISESLKLVVEGSLISLLEDEQCAPESILPGSMIGELGLVNSTRRLTTVKVLSQEAILYSLSKASWQTLIEEKPHVARYIDMLVIQYLAHRVQQASNTIVDRCGSVPV